MAEYLDLLDEIGAEHSNAQGFCNSYYQLWEENTATPALNNKGWIVKAWHTGEGDSFGPLTRYAVCERGGELKRFIYG